MEDCELQARMQERRKMTKQGCWRTFLTARKQVPHRTHLLCQASSDLSHPNTAGWTEPWAQKHTGFVAPSFSEAEQYGWTGPLVNQWLQLHVFSIYIRSYISRLMFTSSRCYHPEGEMEQNEVGRGHGSFNPSVQLNLLSRALITSPNFEGGLW